MSITAIKGQRGEEQAFCTCQDCGGEETIAARHGDNGKERTRNRFALYLHSEAAVIEALKKRGWSNVKNRLRCPKCTDARIHKAQEPTMTTIAPARTLTPEQEVDIIVALSSAYDRKAKRYNGNETDRTIADLVGDGCMPGWVAQIRQDKFGPAGNEEAEAIRADIAKAKEETRRLIETFGAEQQKKLDAITARLDALYRAEDKRVRA